MPIKTVYVPHSTSPGQRREETFHVRIYGLGGLPEERRCKVQCWAKEGWGEDSVLVLG